MLTFLFFYLDNFSGFWPSSFQCASFILLFRYVIKNLMNKIVCTDRMRHKKYDAVTFCAIPIMIFRIEESVQFRNITLLYSYPFHASHSSNQFSHSHLVNIIFLSCCVNNLIKIMNYWLQPYCGCHIFRKGFQLYRY